MLTHEAISTETARQVCRKHFSIISLLVWSYLASLPPIRLLLKAWKTSLVPFPTALKSQILAGISRPN